MFFNTCFIILTLANPLKPAPHKIAFNALSIASIDEQYSMITLANREAYMVVETFAEIVKKIEECRKWKM